MTASSLYIGYTYTKRAKTIKQPLQGLFSPMAERKGIMKNLDAIRSLTIDQLVRFLDQVFLTGLNTGYQSLVDADLDDENPFNTDWVNADVDGSPILVEDETGERLIIEPLLNIVKRIAEFDVATIPGDVSWQRQVVLPKEIEGQDDYVSALISGGANDDT